MKNYSLIIMLFVLFIGYVVWNEYRFAKFKEQQGAGFEYLNEGINEIHKTKEKASDILLDFSFVLNKFFL